MQKFNTFGEFAKYCCGKCNANDWYCTGYCVWLEKAQNYTIKHLNTAMEKCDGDVAVLARRVITWK